MVSRALRRHGLSMLLIVLGASLVWACASPATADACDLCEYWEEQHREETILEDQEEEIHEAYTNRTLRVEFRGVGAVDVHGGEDESQSSWCESETILDYCYWRIPADQPVLLTPLPPLGTIFTGWEGACSGTAACALTMSEEKRVIANFLDLTPPLVPTIATPAKGEVVQQPADSGVVVSFNNSGDTGTRQYLCRLNTSDYRICTSPWTTRHLKAGPNTVRVKARDAAGNTSTPATRRFTVVN